LESKKSGWQLIPINREQEMLRSAYKMIEAVLPEAKSQLLEL
jgi:hypothetical protein